VRLVAALALALVGFVATVTVPAGFTLTAAIATLAIGSAMLANAIADRLIP
jgi:hypothetical protein